MFHIYFAPNSTGPSLIKNFNFGPGVKKNLKLWGLVSLGDKLCQIVHKSHCFSTPPKKLTMTMKKQPWMKMYLLFKMLVFFQPVILAFRLGEIPTLEVGCLTAKETPPEPSDKQAVKSIPSLVGTEPWWRFRG